MRASLVPVIMISFVAALAACSHRQSGEERAAFTEIDTLRETYLILEDSMLATWNAIAHDESEKLKAMHEILNSLEDSHERSLPQLKALEERLEHLEDVRLTQETIEDTNLVDEYDFTSNSLVTEIIALTESDASFTESEFLQEWVDRLKIADQHIAIYRTDYDSVVSMFNRFLEKNQGKLEEMEEGSGQKKRPLF